MVIMKAFKVTKVDEHPMDFNVEIEFWAENPEDRERRNFNFDKGQGWRDLEEDGMPKWLHHIRQQVYKQVATEMKVQKAGVKPLQSFVGEEVSDAPLLERMRELKSQGDSLFRVVDGQKVGLELLERMKACKDKKMLCMFAEKRGIKLDERKSRAQLEKDFLTMRKELRNTPIPEEIPAKKAKDAARKLGKKVPKEELKRLIDEERIRLKGVK